MTTSAQISRTWFLSRGISMPGLQGIGGLATRRDGAGAGRGKSIAGVSAGAARHDIYSRESSVRRPRAPDFRKASSVPCCSGATRRTHRRQGCQRADLSHRLGPCPHRRRGGPDGRLSFTAPGRLVLSRDLWRNVRQDPTKDRVKPFHSFHASCCAARFLYRTTEGSHGHGNLSQAQGAPHDRKRVA